MDLDLKTNQYLILKNSKGDILDKLRWDGKEFKQLSRTKLQAIKPKTARQECLFDLLANKSIPIKIIAGVAGSGKSKLAISHGLHFVLKGDYQKIFIVRHNVAVGEKNGYVKGSKFDKAMAWLGFFEDNIEDQQLSMAEMFDRKTLDTDFVEAMKGRDLKNSFIIVDECEDLTVEQFRMLGERVSYGSTVCFVGDYNQTTQEKYKSNSGLCRAIENLSGSPLVGVIVFDDVVNDNVRSDASKVFTSLY
ncbi:MAG: PhoH family protein [Microgenomates group bacterium]